VLHLYNRLGFLDVESLGFQQAILFLIIGFSILFSGGNILQDKLYKDPSITEVIISGTFQTLLGAGYFCAVYFQHYSWFMRFSWISAAIWFVFSGLFLANSLQLMGIFSLVQGITNTFCCYSCKGKRSYF